MHAHNIQLASPSSTLDRAGLRAAIALGCEVRQGTRPWQRAVLEDLSQQGFRIAGLREPSPDKPLSIRIPGIQLLTARIRWVAPSEVGCEFAQPLHVAVFEHLVKAARPFG